MKTNRNKTVLVVVLSIIIIAAIVAGVVLSMKNRSQGRQSGATGDSQSVVVNEDEVASDRLLADKYPEVNNLISEYRRALTSADVTALKRIYNTQDEISPDVLASTSEIIESYSDTVCYTKRGLEEDSYFVFVYDKLKIKGINTLAPNLTMVYVKSLGNGQYYIYRGQKNITTSNYEYDAETQRYIDALYLDEEVQALMSKVYQEKQAACAGDQALRDFIDGLSSPTGDVTTETVAESESETDESADESEDNYYEGDYSEDDYYEDGYYEDY